MMVVPLSVFHMSQCLKDHQEYECAGLLWKYRP